MDDKYNGLKKAYSSPLRIEERDGVDVIIKRADAQESRSEIFFQDQLKRIGLPAMEMELDDDGLAVLFIPDAETLGDNETPERYKWLGAELRKMHAATFDAPFFIDANGQKQEIRWDQFIKDSLELAVARQKERDGFSEGLVSQMEETVLTRAVDFSGKSSLLHGDLHANNVLIKGSDLYVFDNADQIMAGDPMYDLSLFAITLPGAIYEVGNDVDRDTSLMEALIDGYGYDFTKDKDVLDTYVLLRSLERWPNPFEQKIPQISDVILKSNRV